jgi:DNA mismatch repair protein MutS
MGVMNSPISPIAPEDQSLETSLPLQDEVSKASAVTTMLKQYQALKTKHNNCILFFRLGDFYEMFFEDAKVASRILDLVLTSRGKDPLQKIPMCGVPYHAAENYIARLVKAGHKVAICEQLEDPAMAKGIVKRDITRIITSGTYLDENSNDVRYILSLFPHKNKIGLALSDPAVGVIQTNEYTFEPNKLIELIAKLAVYECVFPKAAEDVIKPLFKHPILEAKNIVLSPHEDWCFSKDIAAQTIKDHFKVHNLNGFGMDGLEYAACATGALLDYLKKMNKQPLRHIDKISVYSEDEYVLISSAALRGLELETLIKTLDGTQTPLGKRKFFYWFLHPLKNIVQIQKRQEAIALFKDNPKIQQALSIALTRIPDLEKNISRLSSGYVHAKDLLAIRNTLNLIPEIQKILEPLKKQSDLLNLNDIPELRTHLLKTIHEDIPLSHPEGKVIARGVHAELDQLKDIQENGRQWLKNFQAKEIERAGINSLKVGFNNIFGYYIEITKTHAHKAPSDYIRKQTLVNAERFITPELKTYEEKILTAEERILKIENELIHALCEKILDQSKQLHDFCESIATLDSLYALSLLASRPQYIRPAINEATLIDIKEGRHPFVEEKTQGNFVPNDTLLDCEDNHFLVLTGPNMAGKSTYIRQTAILTIMAQMGSFIPAQSATIGLVDKIFTRIGAHDDISKGQSTFMVEMNEMADILNNLSDRSLVILDEIGRGTSTYDGLSLAWALADHLQKTKVRTLFATHFHELTALADQYPGVKNYNVAVKEWKDEIIFLHKIVPGSTDDSYGIYVAKLAGIPADVIQRAKHILAQLEKKNDLKEQLKKNTSNEGQLNLFEASRDPIANDIKESIASLDINTLTPLEALNQLQKLKSKLDP